MESEIDDSLSYFASNDIDTKTSFILAENSETSTSTNIVIFTNSSKYKRLVLISNNIDHYELFQVDCNAFLDEIKPTCVSLLLTHHLHRNPHHDDMESANENTSIIYKSCQSLLASALLASTLALGGSYGLPDPVYPASVGHFCTPAIADVSFTFGLPFSFWEERGVVTGKRIVLKKKKKIL